jgi:hypothetical protein
MQELFTSKKKKRGQNYTGTALLHIPLFFFFFFFSHNVRCLLQVTVRNDMNCAEDHFIVNVSPEQV